MEQDALLALRSETRHAWAERDAIIYALGIGLPADPADPRELAFVYEKADLQAFPTLPAAIALKGWPLAAAPINYLKLLHGEQSITLHRPLPVAAQVIGRGRVLGAWDKGPERGAVIMQEKVLFVEGEDAPLATMTATAFARGDGGYGGPAHGQPQAHAMPERAPDRRVEIAVDPRLHLLYRLSGDDNPLHVDPTVAQAAGFPRPILHGLCTFAICCRAVLATFCGHDARRLRHHAVRFSSVVYPGDVLAIDLWRDGDIVSFEARATGRGVFVIRGGRSDIGGFA